MSNDDEEVKEKGTHVGGGDFEKAFRRHSLLSTETKVQSFMHELNYFD